MQYYFLPYGRGILKSEIRKFEAQSRLLEPSHVERQQLLEHVIAYSQHYLEHLVSTPTYTDFGGEEFDPDFAIVEEGIGIEKLLSLLGENVDTVGINLTSSRYLGYIPGGGLFHAALGDYLAAVTNRYAGLFFASPGAVHIENEILRWMAGLIGYPETASGNLTSGGSLAHLTAIVTARDACGISGKNIERSVVYLTGQHHHSIDKALHIAGIGDCVKREVDVDAKYRMDAAALEAAIQADKQAGLRPWLVIASAGTTNTGAVDPLADIGGIANKESCWFHIDGAYGGLFVMCPEGKAILEGTETSDSMIMDPHKTLFLPYGTGTVLVKDRRKQAAAFSADADYIQRIIEAEGDLSPADLSPELTKHFRGLRLWLPLKLMGLGPFTAALSENIWLSRYLYAQLQTIEGIAVGPYPDLSIVTYRYVPKRGDVDAFNDQLMQAIQRDGQTFISGTRVDGQLILRAAILSFRTHLEDIEAFIEVLKQYVKLLENEN